MVQYEYIRLKFDMGDLRELNQLSAVGWHVVAVVDGGGGKFSFWALLEREITYHDGRL